MVAVVSPVKALILAIPCIQGIINTHHLQPNFILKRLGLQQRIHFPQRWPAVKIISWTSLAMDMYRDQGTWSITLINNRLHQSFMPSVRNQSNMSISHSYNQKILHIIWRRDQEWGTFWVQVPRLWANFREVSHPLTIQQIMEKLDPQNFGQILLELQNHRESSY